MALSVAILSGFLIALVSPAITRIARERAGVVLALFPLALAAYFVTRVPSIADGEIITSSSDWVPALNVNLSFYLDGLSLLFAILITGIGALVLAYAGGYLSGHRDIGRFYAIIIAFMASMLGLVVAGNVIVLFVFWELTSLTSYLLIGFDHAREEARKAALQALLVTALGGLALLAGLLLLGQAGGSLELSALLDEGEAVRGHRFYGPILALVLIAAFTKSAQAPFHFWLPNAMQAPTPVSAYLHSATMVKAGVYLLARLAPVLGGTDAWLYPVMTVGALTMLLGAFLALVQSDLKRLLAYSTVSALGRLVMLLGIGTPAAVTASLVLLLAHAFYKGALFLIAGSLEHETGTRDVDRLTGLRRAMPLTATAGFLAALSMAGLPPLFGFIGKESLYEAVLEGPDPRALITTVAFLGSVLLIVAALVAGIRPFLKSHGDPAPHVHEAPAALWLPPLVLGGAGMLVGIFPNTLSGDIISPAAEAVAGRPVEIDLELWHGFTTVLALSILTVLAGAALYLVRRSWQTLFARVERFSGWSSGQLYERSLDALNLAAWAQTRVLQSGYLRFYLLTIIAVTVGAAGYSLVARAGLAGLASSGIRFHEAAVLGMIAVATVVAVLTPSRLVAIAALGAVGYGIALVYLLFGAPDLALAQVLVETLLVILLVLAFYHLPRFTVLSSAAARLRDAAVSAFAGLLVTGLVLLAVDERSAAHVSRFYAENARPEAHGQNVVNVILVDFRALDTLGEITVLLVAAIGVFALLKLRPRRRG